MILYNVTIKIANEVHDDWLNWMKTIHIPDVLNTKLFLENRLCRLLGEDEQEGVTYAIQYLCKDMTTFQQYQTHFAKSLQEEHTQRYKNKYVAFRTLLEVNQISQ